VRAAMDSFDYGPVAKLLESFFGLTGAQASIVSRDNRIYAASKFTRACEFFHNVHPETRAACIESNHRVDSMVPELAGGGYAEYRCANGLRDIAQPLFVEGVHWGTLFLGQFLYDDEAADEAEFSARADRLGWDAADYLSAIREVPRYPRGRIAELMSFFSALGGIVTGLAYDAFKERILTRRNIAAAAALGESDKRYRLLAENVADVIWTLDPALMRFTYVSPSIKALRGMSVEEAMTEPVESSMTPSSFAKVGALMGLLAERLARGERMEGESYTDLFEQPCKGNGTKWVEISLKPVFDAEGNIVEVAGVSRDATARVLADAELKKALADKDRLYAELQHRVKNSLALIVSLLSLEAGSIEDDEMREPIEEAQVRVRSIGLLYEQLYRTRSVGDIELGAYLAEVARAVVESPLGPRGLRLETECESVRIATDRAVPAGLLLYELAANSVKHAFPGGEVGKIRLSLGLDSGTVVLRLEDDGIGLPEGFSLEAGKGLGSLLITQLAEQLGGTAAAGPGLGGAGAGFVVRFPSKAP
jgi:PAS domain S-box-containing protein